MDKGLQKQAFDQIMKAIQTEDAYTLDWIHKSEREKRTLILIMARAMDVSRTSADSLLYRLGWIKALTLLHDRTALQFGVPVMRIDGEVIGIANAILSSLTRTAYLEIIAGGVASSLFTVTHIDTNLVRLFVPNHAGIEEREQEGFEWMHARGYARLHEINTAIKELSHTLEPYVEVSDRYGFISYSDSPPDIEPLFGEWASTYADTTMGADSFPETARFGNVEFRYYCEMAWSIMASARKHLEFCKAAIRRHKTLEPMNILTVPADISKLIEETVIELNIDEIAARSVVEAFIRNPSKPAALGLPPYVRIGSDCVLRSVCGALDNPYVYMLDHLRGTYRADWDSAVDLREDIFRSQVALELAQHGVFSLESSRNISIGKETTDIDVVSVDSSDGILALFQLKWMDRYNYSISARRAKQRNFVESANKWVGKVERWLTSVGGPKAAAKMLGFSKKQSQHITDHRIFILGRWFSLFSDGPQRASSAAWLNWGTFVKSLSEMSKMATNGLSAHPVEWLWRDAKSKEITGYLSAVPELEALESVVTKSLTVEFTRSR